MANYLRSEKAVIAQNEANPHVLDVAFDAESVPTNSEPETIIINIPIPPPVYKAIVDQEKDDVLIDEGTLDNFVYLPIVVNNYIHIDDDFSDPNSGFPIVDTSTNTYQYINGEYQILNKTNSYLGAIALPYELEEFEYGISMRRVGGAMGFYGIIFWLDDTWSEYYLLLLSPDDGEHYYYQYKSDTGYILLSSTGNYQYINPGNGVNRIGMKQYWASNFGVGLFLNKEITINGYSASFSWGVPAGAYRVGFFAAPIDANHQVHFDYYLFKNYCILSPGCPGYSN
ncbi:MAG: hypothetical protein DHS20C20_02510 [Ardenticatenaceae bacterium]|nr:MAG: hypothetical protein DHS20C20_02510 [Ardenticatenaceae bacterium]